MNQYFDRQLISQAVVVIGVCVFGWIMIVQPMSGELVELNEKLAEAKSHPMLLDQSAIENMADRMKDVRQRVLAIQSRNRFAADTSRRYSLIMDLASEHDVVVHRLDPGAMGKAGEQTDVQVARFDMAVEGRFENVANFLQAIDGIDGFVKPMAMIVSPKGYAHEQVVEARVGCETMAFALPNQLAVMTGGRDHE